MLRLARMQHAVARVALAARARGAVARSNVSSAAAAAAAALVVHAPVRAYHASAALRVGIKSSSFKRKKKEKKERPKRVEEAPDAATLLGAEAAALTATRLAVDPAAAAVARPAPAAPARDVQVGERMDEPEPFRVHKVRGIDTRTVEHRIHSAVANRPYWGPHGTWGVMVQEAEDANRRAMEARGQVYTPPLRNWKAISAARAAQTEAEKKAKEEAEAKIVPKDQNKIKAFLGPLGLNEFADKFHSLEHVLSVRTLALRKMGLECQQRKLFLKHTELVRQRQLRGLQLFHGATLPDPAADKPKAAAKA